jgi:hypothetical protein
MTLDPYADRRAQLWNLAETVSEFILRSYQPRIDAAKARGDTAALARIACDYARDSAHATAPIAEALAALPPPPVTISTEYLSEQGFDRLG